jgi:adenylosuccinate lyase
MRQGRTDNDLLERFAADDRLGLTREQIEGLVADPIDFTGAARDQVASVVRRVQAVLAGDPDAASYRPAGIL